MKNFLTRVATGLVFGVALIGSMWLGKSSFGPLFLLIAMCSVKEFCTLIENYKNTTFNKWWAILGGGYLFAAFFAICHCGVEHTLAVFAPYIALVVYVFIQQVFSTEGSKLDNPFRSANLPCALCHVQRCTERHDNHPANQT